MSAALTWDDFTGQVQRLRLHFRDPVAMKPQEADALWASIADEAWPRVRHLPKQALVDGVGDIIANRGRRPDNWVSVIVTTAKEHAPKLPPKAPQSVRDVEDVTKAESAASPAWFDALLRAFADGPGCCEEMGLIAQEIATAEGYCPCRDGVVRLYRLRDEDGNPTTEAYAAPCPNGCGRAADFAESCRRQKAPAVMDAETGGFIRWAPRTLRAGRRRLVLDDDPNPESEWR